jgi:hypothetical protein
MDARERALARHAAAAAAHVKKNEKEMRAILEANKVNLNEILIALSNYDKALELGDGPQIQLHHARLGEFIRPVQSHPRLQALGRNLPELRLDAIRRDPPPLQFHSTYEAAVPVLQRPQPKTYRAAYDVHGWSSGRCTADRRTGWIVADQYGSAGGTGTNLAYVVQEVDAYPNMNVKVRVRDMEYSLQGTAFLGHAEGYTDVVLRLVKDGRELASSQDLIRHLRYRGAGWGHESRGIAGRDFELKLRTPGAPGRAASTGKVEVVVEFHASVVTAVGGSANARLQGFVDNIVVTPID